jgi:hypothetical protein
MAEPRKWSWVEFTIGWINKQFLIWCVSTALIFMSLFTAKIASEKIQFALVIAWGVISLCLFFFKAISVLIKNGKLNIEAKASVGLTKDIKESK